MQPSINRLSVRARVPVHVQGVIACVAALLIAMMLTACGGGGGESTETTKPGTLRTLAVSGQPLPGPTAGNFAPFPNQPIMAAAEGGWSALVAPTDVLAAPNILYVMQPDGVLVEVYSLAEAMPGVSDGTIASFQSVWIAPDGLVTALVSISGDTLATPSARTFAFISAEVSGGAASNKLAVINQHDVVNVSSDTLSSVTPDSPTVTSEGEVWLLGDTSAGAGASLVAASADGATIREMAQVGSTLPSGAGTATSLDVFGVNRAGTQVAFVATASVPGERRLYIANAAAAGAPVYQELAQDGDPLVNELGTIDDVYIGGPLLVDSAGTVAWLAEGSDVGTDDMVVLTNTATSGPVVYARSGQVAPGAAGGTFGDLTLLRQSPGASLLTFAGDIAGGSISFSTYHIVSANANVDPAISVFDQRAAPGPVSGGAFTTTFPGFNQLPYQHVGGDASFAFAQVLDNNQTGVFWLVPFVGLFDVAIEGQPSPMAGVNFSTFNTSPAQGISTDTGQVLFRTGLSDGTTAILRQGP